MEGSLFICVPMYDGRMPKLKHGFLRSPTILPVDDTHGHILQTYTQRTTMFPIEIRTATHSSFSFLPPSPTSDCELVDRIIVYVKFRLWRFNFYRHARIIIIRLVLFPTIRFFQFPSFFLTYAYTYTYIRICIYIYIWCSISQIHLTHLTHTHCFYTTPGLIQRRPTTNPG